MHAAIDHAHPSRSRLYFNIWAVLLGLTLAEVSLTWLPASRTAILGLLVIFAAAKACLVAAYYMHLRWERVVLGLIAILPFPLATGYAVALMLENAR